MHNLLEQYLEEVAAQLNALPVARRNEELREMRQHLLNAAIVNRKMLGQTEEGAVASALEQFGPPNALGDSMVLAWRRETRMKMYRFWGAAIATVGFTFFLEGKEMWLSCLLYTKTTGLDVMSTQCISHLPALLRAAVTATSSAVILGVPSLVGGLCGIFFRRRGASGVLLGTLLYYTCRLADFAWDTVK